MRKYQTKPFLLQNVCSDVNQEANQYSEEMHTTDSKASISSSVRPSDPLDAASRTGRFGWCEVEQEFLPLVYRGADRAAFCSVRAAEELVVRRLLEDLPGAAPRHAALHAELMTEAEARLYREINNKHLDGRLGEDKFDKAAFVQGDKMVKLEDLRQFIDFLKFCRSRFISKEPSFGADRCGFLRIRSEGVESDVPYVVVGGVKHLPLFYFEGETGPAEGAAVRVRGWDLAYLRLLCGVQGVREELVHRPASARAVPLPALLAGFPASAAVEDFWPEGHLLPAPGPGLPGAWARAPAPPAWLGKLATIPIREFPAAGGREYRLQRVRVAGLPELVAVGVRPGGAPQDGLVPLVELGQALGLGVEEAAGLVAGRLKIPLYRPNSGQAALLAGSRGPGRPELLVLVRDLATHGAALQGEERGAGGEQ
jgi:hypothetical protein